MALAIHSRTLEIPQFIPRTRRLNTCGYIPTTFDVHTSRHGTSSIWWCARLKCFPGCLGAMSGPECSALHLFLRSARNVIWVKRSFKRPKHVCVSVCPRICRKGSSLSDLVGNGFSFDVGGSYPGGLVGLLHLQTQNGTTIKKSYEIEYRSSNKCNNIHIRTWCIIVAVPDVLPLLIMYWSPRVIIHCMFLGT